MSWKIQTAPATAPVEVVRLISGGFGVCFGYNNVFPQISLIFSLIAQINTLVICEISVYLIRVICGKQIMTLPALLTCGRK